MIGELSGGERNRVHLAKVLKSGGNVLLLDEPTNDLDVETLRALEEALLSFPGCAVVISHDRWFLDRIATHILAFEGNSEVSLVRRQLFRVRGRLEAPRRGCRTAASSSLPQPARMNDLTLDGSSLTLDDLRRYERQRPVVRLADEARTAIEKSAAAVAATVESGRVAYGINTGFGAFANRVIPASKTQKLQLQPRAQPRVWRR